MPCTNEPRAVFITENGESLKARRHVNQDGSSGGLVPENAEVPNNVFIGKDVIVLPGVEISPGAHITGRCIIGPSIS